MNIANKELKFKRINNLISVGAVFLGSHLIDKLLSKGKNVLCLGNLSTGRTNNINDLRNNSNFL